MENLICAGAFDSLPGNRAQKHEELAKIIDQALEKKKAEHKRDSWISLQPSSNDHSRESSFILHISAFSSIAPDSEKLEKGKSRFLDFTSAPMPLITDDALNIYSGIQAHGSFQQSS